MKETGSPSPAAPKDRGPLYWLLVNSVKRLIEFGRRHKKLAFANIATAAWLVFVFRAYWQTSVVTARAHSPECLTFILSLGALIALFRARKWKWFFATAALMSFMVLLHFRMELPPLRHLTLYLRYRALDPEVLAELPLTDHERIQPLNSIRILGTEAMKEVEHVATPDFVRIDGQTTNSYESSTSEYRWVLGVEPAYEIPRTFGKVKEILSVSALTASPNFSGENRIPVSFRTGEEMHLGKNVRTATIRSFGLLRFFSYSPRDVKYLKNDNGEWVQVVSLIRWKGILFVWPEFGGVQVIRQGPNTLWGVVRSWFVGDGEWIPPEDIGKYRYLQGQNSMPYEVSRYMALSLRFQNGFCDPLPWYHTGDVRIPDLSGDQNDQPFTAYFRFGRNGEDKLYHYFALEPYHDTKQGLNTSVFVPADGVGRVKVYRHYKLNEALTGVSAIAPKVMESRKQYDWEQSRPVEHRPYIRDIDGKRRFFWLTTVVTYKDKKHAGEQGFIAGSTPEMTLTDAIYKNVVWVNPHDPPGWPAELKSKLEVVWKSN